MQSVAIIGTDVNSRIVKKIIDEIFINYKVCCFCSCNEDDNKITIDKLDVINIKTLKERINNSVIDLVLIAGDLLLPPILEPSVKLVPENYTLPIPANASIFNVLKHVVKYKLRNYKLIRKIYNLFKPKHDLHEHNIQQKELYTLENILEMFKKLEITNVYITPYYFINKNYLELTESDIFVKIDVDKPRVNYFEFRVCYHCNLNCKGCSSFSDLYDKPFFPCFDLYKRDLFRLKELYWGANQIFLMGGEPLLNCDLHKYIKITRAIFPDAQIAFVTNGLLITKMSKELVNAINECHVPIIVTVYPIIEQKKQEIAAFLKFNKIKYAFRESWKGKFRNKLTLEPNNNALESYTNCSRKCPLLGEGVISACYLPQVSKKFNEYFKKNINMDDDVIDLYSDINGWELNELLNTCLKSCAYCKTPREFDWTYSSNPKKIEDYLA